MGYGQGYSQTPTQPLDEATGWDNMSHEQQQASVSFGWGR